MGRYIFKRVLWLIPVILGVAILIFSIMYFVPGDPAEMILGSAATQTEIDELHEAMGLNDPYIVQLGRYLWQTFVQFDFGTSYSNKNSVFEQLAIRLPRTAMIAAISCSLQVLIGIPLGITAAVHHNEWQDRLCIVGAMIGISIPNFWLALMLILLFAHKLHWLPAFGIDSWKSYVMPCFCASLGGIANQARFTRTYMLEQIRSDYVVTARAKGLSENKIRYGHALPNTLIPVITGIGSHFGVALGGTVIIENVFSIPGVGQYMVKAINSRDLPVIRGSVVVLSVLFSIIMVLVDLAYAYIDPRIKSQYTSSKRKAKKVKSNG